MDVLIKVYSDMTSIYQPIVFTYVYVIKVALYKNWYFHQKKIE
jgi:hypothetical protein